VLAAEAREILETHCSRCHGYTRREKELNVLDLSSLRDANRRPRLKAAAVVDGKPEESDLLTRVEDESMPQGENTPKVPKDKQKVLRAWIEAGAPRFRWWSASRRPSSRQAPRLRNSPCRSASRHLPRVHTPATGAPSRRPASTSSTTRSARRRQVLHRSRQARGVENREARRSGRASRRARTPPLTDEEKADVEQWVNADAVV
jgi:hypothetical protein